jgi:hypothetical protein
VFRDDVAWLAGTLLAVIFLQVASRWSILCSWSGAPAPQAVAGEIDAMGVVNQPIEDGVGISGVADEGVPFVDRNLAGEDGRATSVAFLEDFVEVTTGRFRSIEGATTPIARCCELNENARTICAAWEMNGNNHHRSLKQRLLAPDRNELQRIILSHQQLETGPTGIARGAPGSAGSQRRAPQQG